MSHALLDDPPLIINPKLAVAIGLEEAVILQQLHWLSRDSSANGRIIEDKRWIFNTYDNWQKEYFYFWGVDKIKKAFIELEKRGLVKSCQPEGVMSRRKYYRVDLDVLSKLVKSIPDRAKSHVPDGANSHDGRAVSHVPITETTSKDYTEKPNASSVKPQTLECEWENELTEEEQNELSLNDRTILTPSKTKRSKASSEIPSHFAAPPATPEEVMRLWNAQFILPTISAMTSGRVSKLKTLNKTEFFRLNWREGIMKIHKIPWMMGKTDPKYPRPIGIDMFLRPDWLASIMEYDIKESSLEPAAAKPLDRSSYTEEHFQRYASVELKGSTEKLTLETISEPQFKAFIKYADDYK